MNGLGATARRIGTGVLVAACITASVSQGTALAAPVADDASYVVRTEETDAVAMTAFVHSAAMDRTIPLKILRSPDRVTPSPTVYLLNGAGGGVDGMDWYTQTDVVSFFADKNVNVVTPVGGAYSYYTDW
ncbi:esterase family protein [Rhodococcus sp. 1R11]|uniref:esterase family protein n=1 Tax=Rhodococcus sp. 1R11 TaxID=2559614 RepID=UPI001FD6E03D|nr:esterase family protein [Rhodococcus sp. 1R11]